MEVKGRIKNRIRQIIILKNQAITIQVIVEIKTTQISKIFPRLIKGQVMIQIIAITSDFLTARIEE